MEQLEQVVQLNNRAGCSLFPPVPVVPNYAVSY